MRSDYDFLHRKWVPPWHPWAKLIIQDGVPLQDGCQNIISITFQKISASNNPRDMIFKSKHNVIGVDSQTLCYTYDCVGLSPWLLVLCDIWNRSDDNDTVSGIAILDTTAIPEMRYAISMFFRNRQSHRPTLLTEMCVSSSVPTVCIWQGYSMLCILHEVRACVSKQSSFQLRRSILQGLFRQTYDLFLYYQYWLRF